MKKRMGRERKRARLFMCEHKGGVEIGSCGRKCKWCGVGTGGTENELERMCLCVWRDEGDDVVY